MDRITEPELMDAYEQAKAYAEADFSEPNERFLELFKERFKGPIRGYVLDLGCGPADISVRFAHLYPECAVHAVDGSEAMLFFAKLRIKKEPPEIRKRVKLYHARIPEDELPLDRYDVIISNSLLHHLPNPMVLWECIRKHSKGVTLVMVMDLMRPETPEMARKIVETYAKQEPELLRKDFYNSLCAAFTPEEVREQLRRASIPLKVDVVSDRHLLAWGIFK